MSAARGTSAAATASRRLLHRTHDRELWEVDRDLWCVHRPRHWTVTVMTAWFTLAGSAAVVAIACGLVIVLAGEGGGFWWWTIGCGVLAAFALLRGRRALAADRELRARSIDDLPHVVIDSRAATLRASDGTSAPLSAVRVSQEEVDLGEVTRHELVLVWPEHSWIAFHHGRAAGLAPAAATLARFGLPLRR